LVGGSIPSPGAIPVTPLKKGAGAEPLGGAAFYKLLSAFGVSTLACYPGAAGNVIHQGDTMKNCKALLLTVVVAGSATTLAAGSLRAKETKIPRDQVPSLVLLTLAQRQPDAEVKGFAREEEKGKTVYEVELMAGGRRTDLIVSPEGEVLVEEQSIPAAELPAAVRQGLAASAYGKAEVLEVEKVTHSDRPSAPTYELMVKSGAQRHELEFTADGKLKQAAVAVEVENEQNVREKN